MTVASYPVKKHKLSDSKEVRLIIDEAKGEAKVNALLKNQQLNVQFVTLFKNIKYDLDAKSKVVKEILTNVISGLPDINVESRATGSWGALKWNIRSNLGKELQKGFEKQVKVKIKQAQSKLDDFVNQKVGGGKSRLKNQLAGSTGGVDQTLKSKGSQIESAKNKAQGKMDSGKNAQTKKIENDGKKALKKLKKKFKLDF